MAESNDRVLHLAGIRKSYGSGEVESEILHGIDLSPVMAGKPIAQRPAMFWAYGKAGKRVPPQHAHCVGGSITTRSRGR